MYKKWILPALSAFCVVMPILATTPLHAQATDVAPAVLEAGAGGMPRTTPRGPFVPGFMDAVPATATPALDVPALLAEDAQQVGGPMRSGIVVPVVARSDADGTWRQLDDGSWLWSIRIQAPEAVAMRIRIEPWPLPASAQLCMYNWDQPNECYGPFDANWVTDPGAFWSPILFASDVCLEYWLPAGADPLTQSQPLVVTGIVNQYRGFEDEFNPRGGEVSCHRDVNCVTGFALERDGVAVVASIDNNGNIQTFCSGTMLNRTHVDFTTLFATATHCGVTNGNVGSTIAIWFFQSNSCGGTVPSLFTLPQTVGRRVLRSLATEDWTLIGLAEDVPGGVTFNGWNSGNWLGPDFAFGIHHPRGAFKRFSSGTKEFLDIGSRPPTSGSSCVAGSALFVSWSVGLTEPGSSGSPVFSGGPGTGRVRGVLSCGNAANCSGGNTSTYGRLEQAFSQLQPFLDPVDPMHVDNGFSGTERGTSSNPMNTVVEGVWAVRRGSTVRIEAGSYNETMLVEKAMTLLPVNGSVLIGQ